MADEWLTTSEVAETLRVTRQTVGRWIREGRLPAQSRSSPSGRVVYRVRKQDLLAFVQRYIREP
jgi:excisionase family DNA binding protein